MTYIPDCRTDANYNQKYLNEKDKEFLRGFDWCTEMAVDNFFDNNYEFNDDSFVAHEVLQKVSNGDFKEKYTMEFTFGDREEEDREVETIIDKVRYEILAWIESERDMLITSMLDGYGIEEYDKIKAEVDANENV